VAWPFAARVQQAERVRRIGVLMGPADDREGKARMAGFLQALQQLGWTGVASPRGDQGGWEGGARGL